MTFLPAKAVNTMRQTLNHDHERFSTMLTQSEKQARTSNLILVPTATAACLLLICGTASLAQDEHRYTPPPMQPIDWRAEEKGILENHLQLTTDADFYKAGEQYFSPDMKWVIFQAVPLPTQGEEPEPFYTMYVAPVEYNDAGRITGLGNAIQVSPKGSANTCGFFHPTAPGNIIFGSTIQSPSQTDAPGFQRQSSKYKWMFPPEMEVVAGFVPQIATGNRSASNQERVALTPVTQNDKYDAECAYSPDGRFIVYGSVLPDERGVDLFIYDSKTHKSNVVVSAPGYDGGPFFNPDGNRICYRSDRDGSNLLQVMVAELKFAEDGSIVGIEKEHQLTNNLNVNWGPYWHPDGRHIIYATSEVSHFNYELFIVDADPGNIEGSDGPSRYGTNHRRVTHANGFDGLPVFSPDGKYLMWASQRVDDPATKGRTQIWLADFIMPLDPDRSEFINYDPSKHSTSSSGGALHESDSK